MSDKAPKHAPVTEPAAKPAGKPWGGRFDGDTAALLEAFSASVGFDRRLAECDVRGSIVHARTLARAGVLTDAEADALEAGLGRIREELRADKFVWSVALEDVHMNIESRLVELVGDIGKKLHTGRSRNDQVVTDMRLYLRGWTDVLARDLHSVQSALVAQAGRHARTVMPGFTHLQVAQPVSFAHHMLSWFEMLKRDRERLADARRRINILPLGAAALAGAGYPLDRAWAAAQLGFDGVSANSMDAIADRDFLIELCAACALTMTHLSRFAEDITLWMSQPFSFATLPDAWCTGSSIMPQKKNPDAPELVRGKTSRVCGALVSLLALLKAQSMAYNRDLQEDKEVLFDALDTTHISLQVMAGVIGELEVNRERMRDAARAGYSTATELADYLVRRGVPFRDAHGITGRIVRVAVERGCALDELDLDSLREICPQIDETVMRALDPEASLDTKDCVGGAAPHRVAEATRAAQEYLALDPAPNAEFGPEFDADTGPAAS